MRDKVREKTDCGGWQTGKGSSYVRSPRRDTHALDYDLYALTTHDGGRGTIHEQGPISIFALDLDEVHQHLVGDGRCHICSTELSHNGLLRSLQPG